MAQDIAPRRALPCSKAREPRPHAAHAHHRPCAQHFPRNKQARPEHFAVHTQHCAHKPQAQTLHTCTGCSRTRTDRTHAPSTRHLHVRSIAQQHAQPCLSQLSTPQSDLWVPASSSSRSRLFLDTIRSSTLTIAANARCADSSRSAAPASLQPAAAAAAPVQRSLRAALQGCPATLCELTRAPRSQPATFHTHTLYLPTGLGRRVELQTMLPFGDGTGPLRMLARAFQSLKCSQSQIFKRLKFSNVSHFQSFHGHRPNQRA